MRKPSRFVVQVLAAKGIRAPRAVTRRSVDLSLELLSQEKLSAAARRKLARALEVTVVFVESKEIRRLNRTFRAQDKPTDILSFEAVEDGSLGELVIALDVIRRQSREHGLSLADELSYMVLHGLLHLLGYDHESSSAEARKMFGIQDRIFSQMRSSIRGR